MRRAVNGLALSFLACFPSLLFVTLARPTHPHTHAAAAYIRREKLRPPLARRASHADNAWVARRRRMVWGSRHPATPLAPRMRPATAVPGVLPARACPRAHAGPLFLRPLPSGINTRLAGELSRCGASCAGELLGRRGWVWVITPFSLEASESYRWNTLSPRASFSLSVLCFPF